jgi:hypothetical protein
MKTYAIALIGLVLFSATGVEAGTRVCFGQYDGLDDCLRGTLDPRACTTTCRLHGYDKKYHCDDKATVDTACQEICGTKHHPNGTCTSASLRPSTGGNQCGYVWIEFFCN